MLLLIIVYCIFTFILFLLFFLSQTRRSYMYWNIHVKLRWELVEVTLKSQLFWDFSILFILFFLFLWPKKYWYIKISSGELINNFSICDKGCIDLPFGWIFSQILKLQAFVSLENLNNFTATVGLILWVFCPSNVF